MKRILAVALLASAPLSGVQAHGNHGTQVGIGAEIRHELADARKEVRIDLAKARRELETDNLRLDKGLRFGQDGTRKQPNAPARASRLTVVPQMPLASTRGDGRSRPRNDVVIGCIRPPPPLTRHWAQRTSGM